MLGIPPTGSAQFRKSFPFRRDSGSPTWDPLFSSHPGTLQACSVCNPALSKKTKNENRNPKQTPDIGLLKVQELGLRGSRLFGSICHGVILFEPRPRRASDGSVLGFGGPPGPWLPRGHLRAQARAHHALLDLRGGGPAWARWDEGQKAALASPRNTLGPTWANW